MFTCYPWRKTSIASIMSSEMSDTSENTRVVIHLKINNIADIKSEELLREFQNSVI